MTEASELSERETQVLRLVATGASNKQIAKDLSISQNTVKVHVRNIFSKTGVASRTEAAIFAVQTGVIDPAMVPLPEPGADLGERPPGRGWRAWPLWQKLTIAIGGLLLAGVLLAGLYLVIENPFNPPTGPGGPASATIPLDRWQERAPLSAPRTGLALAAYENRIYAIAGETPNGMVGTVEVYNPATNRWEPVATKPTPVRDIVGVVIGGRIYVPGGARPDGTLSSGLEIYDPAQDSWQTGASLPAGLSAYAAVAFEGQLYLFGGWDGGQYLDSVLRYDPDSDTWASLSPMPTPRGFAGAADSGGRIYVIGGTDGSGPLKVNEEYTPEAERNGASAWRQATPLPDGRYSLGLASIAGIIHLIGGVAESGESAAYKYYPQEGRWEAFEPSGPSEWTGLGLVALESNIHAVGGEEAGELSSVHQAYVAIYTTSIPIVQ